MKNETGKLLNHSKLVLKRVISAEREAVFDAWTKPELMQQWLFPGDGRAISSNELRVGGVYSHEMIQKKREVDCSGGVATADGYTSYPHHGEYLEIKRPEKLVFTWNSEAVKDSRVTVELRTVGSGTEVTITHELPEDEKIRNSHDEGWNGCLDKLASFLG